MLRELLYRPAGETAEEEDAGSESGPMDWQAFKARYREPKTDADRAALRNALRGNRERAAAQWFDT